MLRQRRDGARVIARNRAFAVVGRGKADPGDRREPFLQLAVETVLPVAREELQKPDDEGSGGPRTQG